MAEPLTLKEIRARLAELQDWEVSQISDWFNAMPPQVAYIMPRVHTIRGEVHGDLTRRQIAERKPDEGEYSAAIKSMYGL